jgi:hypothetical protein
MKGCVCACFKPREIYVPKPQEQDTIYTLNYNFVNELNNLLGPNNNLSVAQYTGDMAYSMMQGIPDNVCNKDYLNEILQDPVRTKNYDVYLLLVYHSMSPVALCYYEVSKSSNVCTIHLLCNGNKASTDEKEIRLGALLMRVVILSISKIYKELKAFQLVAEAEENTLSKLVSYYSEFGFQATGLSSSNGSIAQQTMTLQVGQTNQCNDAPKEYITYKIRRSLVKKDANKKLYCFKR